MNNNEFLNREQEKIITATNEVNNSINKEQIIEVNNQFNISVPSKKKRIVIILLIIILFFIGLFFILRFAKKVVNSENSSSPTTTLKISRIEEYLLKTNKVRKFEGNNNILFLFPNNINKYNNDKYYALINNNEIKIGTYNLEKDNINLIYNNESILIKILSNELYLNEESLNIHETEMKYYLYIDDNIAKLLLINGTIGKEQAFVMTFNNMEMNVNNYNYAESMENIILDNGEVYNKVDNDLDNDGIILNYIN